MPHCCPKTVPDARSGPIAPLRSAAVWAKLRVPPVKTVLEVLESTAKYFADRGVESPRLNIDLLLAHVLGIKRRMDLYMVFDRPLNGQELDALREFVKRRSAGEPLQHLLGTVEFHGREFLCDRRALVPRPETERLVELLLKLPLPEDARCVDVGTGSGIIALTLAAERPAFRVQAVDRSGNALRLAQDNAKRLNLTERVELLQSDLLAACAGPYDLVAANLPYIPAGDIAGLSREVQHDPMIALDGGADGLELVARCVAQAHERLAPGGRIALEMMARHDPDVVLLDIGAGFADVESVRDYQEAERFAFGVKG